MSSILKKLLGRTQEPETRRARPAGVPMTSRGARSISGAQYHDIDPDTVPLFKPEWPKYKSSENFGSRLTPGEPALDRRSNNNRAVSIIEAVASGRDPYRVLETEA